MRLAEINIYPVKACHRITLNQADVTPRGLLHDRRWMLVTPTEPHERISQRLGNGKLALVRTEMRQDGVVTVNAPGMPSLQLDPAGVGANTVYAVIADDKTVTGHVAPAAWSAWFSQYLGKECMLIYQHDNDMRYCSADFAARPGMDHVSLADAYPVLITNTASLPPDTPMNRFRPNLTLDLGEPDLEYRIKILKIGNVIFDLVKPCTRCDVTTIDQDTGKPHSKGEPLETLKRTHFLNQKMGWNQTKVLGAIFGMNAIPRNAGTIRAGDKVEILAWQPSPEFIDIRTKQSTVRAPVPR